MTKLISSLFTGQSLTLVGLVDGKLRTEVIQKTHPNWAECVAAYKAKNYKKVISLINVKQAIQYKSKGNFTIEGDSVLYKGQPVTGYLFDRIIDTLKEGLDFERLLKFADLLWKNPSKRAREELYKFLESKNFTIDEDGYVIAWKGISEDGYSVNGSLMIKLKQGKTDKSGRVFNGVGETIEMDRGDVDDSANAPCSRSGLHVGNYEYASGYASRLVAVKFSPEDAVALAHADTNKLRVCKYKVIAEEGKGSHNIEGNAYVPTEQKIRSAGPKRDKNGRFAKKR